MSNPNQPAGAEVDPSENPNQPVGAEVDPSESSIDESDEQSSQATNEGEDPGTLEVDPSEAPKA